MTKAEVLNRLNITQAKLADQFGISRSAVSLWKDDEELPFLRQVQLEQKYPGLFKAKMPNEKVVAA